MYFQITKSDLKHKKYMSVFYDIDKKKIKTTHFGDNRYEDYTIHKDDERKKRYLDRHKKEDWDDYMSAGSLSRYILWNKTTLNESINDYAKRFGLKIA